MMSNFLRQYNSSIDSTMAVALSWGGLQETEAWKGLGADTTMIKVYNGYGRLDQADTSSYKNYGLKKCK